MSNLLYVVGDRFASFSKFTNIVSVSELLGMLKSGYLPRNAKVVLGQGLSQLTKSEVQRQVKAVYSNSVVEVVDEVPEIAGRRLCHKHQEKNVLVSVPARVASNQFELDFRVDEDCAEMSDHLTGQHIQGMVLIEAARQSFLSVAEEFYCDPQAKVYFVLDTFKIRYENFVFPLPTKIELSINSFSQSKRGVLRFDATASFVQLGKLACTVQGEYRVYAKEFLAAREAEMAREAVSGLVRAHTAENASLEPQRAVAGA